jgi:ATP-binding cassette subfamily B protein
VGPGWTIASLALVVIQGALPLLTLYLMKLIVDAVTFSFLTGITGGLMTIKEIESIVSVEWL